MRRFVAAALSLLAVVGASTAPVGAEVPVDANGYPHIDLLTTTPSVVRPGDRVTFRGAGCAGDGPMVVRWSPDIDAATRANPGASQFEGPVGPTETAAVAADGSFSFELVARNPAGSITFVVAWCVEESTGEAFRYYGIDGRTTFFADAPFRLHGPLRVGGRFAFDAPCGVPAGSDIEVTLFAANLSLTYYLLVRRHGPVSPGERITEPMPYGAKPGQWHAVVQCPSGERYELPFRMEPAGGVGPGPTPAPRRGARSVVDVEPNFVGASMLGHRLGAEIVAIDESSDRFSYVLAGADGGVFTYGASVFQGSAAGLPLAAPVVDVAADARGYWLAAADGGVFAFGVPFFGSAATAPLRAPIVAIVPTRTGNGYWLVAADGGVFAFGDAPFHGAPALVSAPITDAAPLGDGYVLAGADGAVHVFGARFHGSAVGYFLPRDHVVAVLPGEDGYRLVSAAGDSAAFGPRPPAGLNLREPYRRVLDHSGEYALVVR